MNSNLHHHVILALGNCSMRCSTSCIHAVEAGIQFLQRLHGYPVKPGMTK